MNTAGKPKNLELVYTIICDDVRLEVGNKLSLMGVFQNITVPQFPVTVIKFAVVNQWRGDGSHLSEVRILTDDRRQHVVVSQPTPFEVGPGGVAANVSFFFNVVFPAPGQYRVQTLVDSNLFDEQLLTVLTPDALHAPDPTSEAVN